MNYEKYIDAIPDFPIKGISFKDISPLLRDPVAFHACIDDLSKLAREFKPDFIIGPESRGFVFGAALAYQMGIGFIMCRKEGKLPGKNFKVSYSLEYGKATMEIREDSFKKGGRVLLVDDLIATGGSLKAMKDLIILAGATPVAAITVVRLKELEGEKAIGLPFRSLIDLSDKE